MVIKLSMVILFVVISIGAGFYSKRSTSGVEGFVLGGNTVGPWLSAFAYGTSYFSAVIFVGYAGQFGYKFGISSTWVGLGNAILGSFLAWAVLGRRTRIMTRTLKSSTMPDFFGKRFDSKVIKIAASGIIFVFLIPYTASLYNGLSRIFGIAFDVDYTVCILFMAVLTAIYVVVGGYLATALNDLIQGIIMIAGIIATVGAVLSKNGGFTEAIRRLATVEDATVSTQPGVFASFFGPDLITLFSVIILTSLGTWALPQMVHKFYAIKDEKAIKAGTVISTIFAVIVAGGSYFMGGFARLYDIDLNNGYDSIVPTMVESFSDVLIGLVAMLVLSASMSTLSSLVLTSSSTLTLDLVKGHIIKDMSEKRQLRWIRWLVVVFVGVSVVLAVIQYRFKVAFIAQFMGISWGALSGSFIGPFIYGLFWKRTTSSSVMASFIFGVGFTTVNMFLKIIPSSVMAGAVTMVASLVIVPLVSLMTKRVSNEVIEHSFSDVKALLD
jgi:SSS family solute:Na+ symporter